MNARKKKGPPRPRLTVVVTEAEEMTPEQLEAWADNYVRLLMELEGIVPTTPRPSGPRG